MSTATKTRALTLRPHEARRLRETGRVLIVREVECYCNSTHNGSLLGDWGLSVPPHRFDGGEPPWKWRGDRPAERGDWIEVVQADVDDNKSYPVRCPFGPVGSELWGREKYCLVLPNGDPIPAGAIVVEPIEDQPTEVWFAAETVIGLAHTEGKDGLHWRSSTSMPRWASRFPRLILAACEVKRAGEATPDEIIATGLADGPLGIPADRWCWLATIEDAKREGAAR